MRVEDVRVSAAEFVLRALLDRFELAARQPHRRTKTSSLAFEICVADLGAINIARAFLQTQYAAHHHAFGHAESAAAQFLCSRSMRTAEVVVLSFIKITRKQTDDRVERFLFVFAVWR